MSQDCNLLKRRCVSIKEFRQPAIGTVHELGYFFGDAERKVKEPAKKYFAKGKGLWLFVTGPVE